jgi:hypothetical protein
MEGAAETGVLNTSGPTVRTHLSNIMGKLHLGIRLRAARRASREGLALLDAGANRCAARRRHSRLAGDAQPVFGPRTTNA